MRKLVALLCATLVSAVGLRADTTEGTSTESTDATTTDATETTPLCVGFSFNNGAARSDSGFTTSATKDTSGAVKGTSEALEQTEWFYVANYQNGSVTNVFPFTVEESTDATETAADKPVITWKSANVYSTNRGTTFLDGYLDDGSGGNTITVTSFTNRYAATDYKYDVIIYFATDTSSVAFVAPTVNNKRYTYDSENPATAKEGTDTFGSSTQLTGKAQYGVNALRVRGLTGDLTIAGGGSYAGARGGIAAIQIVPHNYTSTPTLTIGGTDKTSVAWSTAENWSPATAPTSVGHANVDLEGDATLDLDADIAVTNKLTLSSTTAESRTLTLTKSDATKTTTIGALATYGVSLAVADTNAYKAVESLTRSAIPLTVKAKIEASSGLPFGPVAAGRTFAGGAGSETSPISFSHSGNSMTLSGETPFYLADNLNSGTQTAVTFDGATVNYGDGRFTVGTATYLLTNANVTATRFILSDGGNGRTSAFTLAGSSVLTVTGAVNADQNTSSAMFGHWAGTSTFTLKDDAQFLVPSAQVLVAKTRKNQTININGGLFSADGIALAGYASDSNTLNLNGGTLALGSVGLSAYPKETQTQTIDASRDTYSMAVTVGGDATMLAKATEFPIWHPVTISDGKTLTLAKTNEVTSATFTFSSTISGEGTLKIKEGVNVNFGTARPAKIEVADGAAPTLAFTLSSDVSEDVTIPCTGLTSLDNVVISNGTEQVTTDAYATLDTTNQTLTIKPSCPVLTCPSGESTFETASNWSGSSVPTSGDIMIKTVADTESVLTIGENHSYGNVYVFGTGTLTLKGAGVLTLTGSVVFREAAQMTLAGNVFAENTTINLALDGTTLTLNGLGDFKNAVTGAGKVKTVGDVKFTKASSFTGGLTVTSGTASTSLGQGFGGSTDANTAGTVTVEDGGCVDLANTKDRCYSYVIAGKGVAATDGTYSGAMKNTGDNLGGNNKQTKSITLAADALITADSSHNWGILNNGWNASTFKLEGYTLTKQGGGDFFISNVTTSSSSGTIVVEEGSFTTYNHTSNANSSLNSSTLNGATVKVVGTSTLNLGQALNGVSALVLSPAAGGVTLNTLGNLASTATVSLNDDGLDVSALTPGESTVTLVTGSADTITNGFATVDLGSRFMNDDGSYAVAYSEAGTTLTADLLALPAKFFHYDFNGSTMSATDSKATDSRYQLGSFSGAGSIVAKGRTGSSGWIVSGKTPYWDSTTSPASPLASYGELTVTMVARLPFATGAASPLLCLGTVHGSNAVIILRVVDATTVAAVAIDVGTKQGSTGREIARVTDIENLSTQFHFFALVTSSAGTRLYVDRMTVVENTNAAPTTSMTNCGQIGSIFGGTTVYPQNLGSTGFYLDDLQIYDVALTEAQVKELRRKYCPDPFFILVK